MAAADEAGGWVVAQVPGGCRVVRRRRLTGGLTSEVTALDVEDVGGRVHRLVLRRWTGEPWPDGAIDDGGECTAREARVLAALEGTGIDAPRLVAVDPSGASAGLPALLMTRLPGRLVLSPSDEAGWLRGLAEQLPPMHALAPGGLPAYESWLDLAAEVPAWTAHPQAWRRLLARAAEAPPTPEGTFVHHDYQEFNVLWSARGHVSGVVDWVWASQGPPDEDVAHCWLNLCLLHGPDAAEEFRRVYESAAGRVMHPWWRAAAVVEGSSGWDAVTLQRQAGRRLRLDQGAFNTRLDAAAVQVLADLDA